jgi:hypothetical protein
MVPFIAASNLEHQMRSAWRPAHLLLGVHPTMQQPLYRAYRDRRGDWLLVPPDRRLVDDVANSATTARQAASAIRGHWHIENKLRNTRDVTFQEDQSRIRHNPGIFARLRSFAYNILQRNRTSTFSQDRYAAALGGLDALLKLCFS